MSKATSLTLGPSGRLVVIDPFDAANFSELSVKPQPLITKDGVTVASHLQNLSVKKTKLEKALVNIGSKLCIDASERTNEESGDGTTTTTVIAKAVLEHGTPLFLSSNVNQQSFRKGVDFAVKTICNELDKISTKVTNKQ